MYGDTLTITATESY